MFVTDGTIVNVALPVIQDELGFTTATLTWVITAYALAFGGCMLLSGRLAGILGARRTLVIGVSAFVVASVLGGFATTPEWLVAARAGQGVAAAIAAPSGFMLIMANTSAGRQRTRALSLVVVASGLGGALGLLAGGLLTSAFGWQAVMFVNAPFGFLVLGGAVLFVREAPKVNVRIDYAGAILSTMGMTLLVYALTSAESAGWMSPLVLGCLGGALIAFIGLAFAERRHEAPVVPFGMFRSREIAGPLVTSFFMSAGISTYLFFVTLYTQQVMGLEPLGTGLILLPFVAAQVIASQIGTVLVRTLGERVVGVSGLTLLFGGQIWLSFVDVNADVVSGLILPTVLMGVGVGLGFPQVLSVVLHHAPQSSIGTTSSLMSSVQQLGGSIGIASLTGLATAVGLVAGQPKGLSIGILAAAPFILVAAIIFAITALRTSPPGDRLRERDSES